jgi:hypothetical protein
MISAATAHAQSPDSLGQTPPAPTPIAPTPTTTKPRPTTPSPTTTPELTVPLDTTETVDITGRGSLGVSGGGMVFVRGGPYGDEGLSKTRLIGQAVFKYNFTSSLAGVAEFGWGWNTYTDGAQDTIVVMVPVTLGVEYRKHVGGKFWPHVAAGGGLYWMGVKDTPDSYASAGDNDKELKWTSPGLYGKLGTEYLFDNGVSINFDVLFHHVRSRNEDFLYTQGDLSSPLNNQWGLQNTTFGEVRLGVNYYFAFKHQEAPAPKSPPEEKK